MADMSIGSVSASNGNFIITDANGNTQQVDLGTLMMMLNIDRTKNLDDQLAAHMDEIQERNTLISNYTEFLSACRKMKADEDAGYTTEKVTNPDYTLMNTRLDEEIAKLKNGGLEKKSWELDAIYNARVKIEAAKIVKAEFEAAGKSWKPSEKITQTNASMVEINGVSKPLFGEGSWAEELGIEWSQPAEDRTKDNKDKWDAQWDANINAVKGKIDLLNNDSQLANIRLQNLLEKRNNAYEMATKVMDTNNQSLESVIRNL